MTETDRMPTVFIGHGSPMAALEDNPITRSWGALGRRLPRPKAIVAISAHWECKGVLITAGQKPRTIHDFYRFPQALYDVQYPAPGDPALAMRIEAMLAPGARADLDSWGLDHGSWAVLRHMYPEADIPVVQISMDVRKSPEGHYQIGQALAPLRDEGVLILGSGNIVHNLRLFDPRQLAAGEAFPWARRFDALVRDKVLAGDHAALVDYPSLDPDVMLAFPEPEHFQPLLYVLGAQRPGEPVEVFNTLVASSMSMTSVLIGAAPAEALAA